MASEDSGGSSSEQAEQPWLAVIADAKNSSTVEEILVGGDSGVPYGALIGAVLCGIRTRGRVCPGKCTDNGVQLYNIDRSFNLVVPPGENPRFTDNRFLSGRVERDKWLIDAADGTIYLSTDWDRRTEKREKYIENARGYCKTGEWKKSISTDESVRKPFLLVRLPKEGTNEKLSQMATRIREFAAKHNIKSLHIMGTPHLAKTKGRSENNGILVMLALCGHEVFQRHLPFVRETVYDEWMNWIPTFNREQKDTNSLYLEYHGSSTDKYVIGWKRMMRM